jgi:hypothetical protein
MQSVFTAASQRAISPERFLREGPRRCAKTLCILTFRIAIKA